MLALTCDLLRLRPDRRGLGTSHGGNSPVEQQDYQPPNVELPVHVATSYPVGA